MIRKIKLILNRIFPNFGHIPGMYFLYIFFGSAFGVFVIGLILFFVYADLSPRNQPVRTIMGSLDLGNERNNKIIHRKEEHIYRFQGKKNDLVILRMNMHPHLLYDIELLLENPDSMYEKILEEYFVEKESGIIVKEFLLNNTGTYTLLVKYDFEKQHNYYDFDLFWFDFDDYSVKYPDYNLSLVYVRGS
tara:strand:- start:1470 stop:2039 length:570 start_codon:yes stop_codon:yes gene_type:complete